MPGSRAQKQTVRSQKTAPKGKKESARTPSTEQYKTAKDMSTGPNYPQWHLRKGTPITK